MNNLFRFFRTPEEARKETPIRVHKPAWCRPGHGFIVLQIPVGNRSLGDIQAIAEAFGGARYEPAIRGTDIIVPFLLTDVRGHEDLDQHAQELATWATNEFGHPSIIILRRSGPYHVRNRLGVH